MQPKITPTFKDTLAEGFNTHFGSSEEILGSSVPITQAYPFSLEYAKGFQQTGFTKPPEAPLPSPARPLKVALVGTAPSSKGLAPYDDPEWQIWVCSPGNMGAVPKADAWFEIHDNLDWPEFKGAYGDKYVAWLKTLAIPVFMQNQRLVPGARVFPKDELINYFKAGGAKRCECFFGSSFAWMIALAIMSGAKEIRLYGIDMASPGEYATQRASFYYWLEKAEERGVVIDAPYESDIMIAPALYGYEEVTPEGRKLMVRMQEIKDRIAQGQQLVAQAQAELEQKKDFVKHLSGAAENQEYHIQINMSHRPLIPNPSV